jgi:hypothetical protein
MSTAPTAPPAATPPKVIHLAPLHGPWPATGRWSRIWPGIGRPADAGTVLAITAAGLVATLDVPLDRPGIGWLVAALTGTAALVIARRTGNRLPADAPIPRITRPAVRLRPDRYAWGAATIALLAVGTFRSAGWLFLLCLATATLTGALALTGGRSLRSIAIGYAMSVISTFRAPLWLSRGAARLRGGARAGTGAEAGAGPNIRIAATVGASVALLTVFGALFASADQAFADALTAIAPDLSVATAFRWVFVFVVTSMIVGGAAYLRSAPPDLSESDIIEGRKVSRLEWAIPLCLLVALFAAFVAVQLTVLFGGERHVLGTDGLTYANYARGGFWQLSFVTGLTLVVLAGAARWAPREQPADRVLIRVVLGALAALTLVIVASALHRMNLYAETYGLTALRLLVACCEAWFGLVLLLVLAAGVRIRATWLPRVAIAVGVAALFGLAAANPDQMIADYNIRQDRTIDLDYLATLSPDAVPALSALNQPERDCVLGRIELRLRDQPDDWRGWNLGRERARTVLRELTPRCS